MNRWMLGTLQALFCVVAARYDGYDRFDLCFGFLAALYITWLLGYERTDKAKR